MWGLVGGSSSESHVSAPERGVECALSPQGEPAGPGPESGSAAVSSHGCGTLRKPPSRSPDLLQQHVVAGGPALMGRGGDHGGTDPLPEAAGLLSKFITA